MLIVKFQMAYGDGRLDSHTESQRLAVIVTVKRISTFSGLHVKFAFLL